MAWTWTKLWSSIYDGTILSGNDLQNLQTDITSNAVDLTSTQTILGDKTFSGSAMFTGSVVNVAKISEFVFWEDSLVSYNDEAVVYQ